MIIQTFLDTLPSLKFLSIVKCTKLCYRIGSCNFCHYTKNNKKHDQFQHSINCRSMCWFTISVKKCNRYCDASLVSQTYLFFLLNEVRHVNSSFRNNQGNSWHASIKWQQLQCADLNIQHSWHLKSFDGMPYCNTRWYKETAKLRWLFEMSKHAQY